jgi:hypothetical protein
LLSERSFPFLNYNLEDVVVLGFNFYSASCHFSQDLLDDFDVLFGVWLDVFATATAAAVVTKTDVELVYLVDSDNGRLCVWLDWLVLDLVTHSSSFVDIMEYAHNPVCVKQKRKQFLNTTIYKPFIA